MKQLGARFDSWREDLFSVRGAVAVLSWICVAAAVVGALSIGRDVRKAEEYPVPEIMLNPDTVSGSQKSPRSLEQYRVIRNRDLFKVSSTEAPKPVSSGTATQLKMRLVGTSVASSGPIAILEDLNKNEQDVFGVGENIFGRARLLTVGNESVKVDFNGREETLFIEEGTGGEGRGKTEVSDDESEFTIPEAELTDALSNLPLLLSQARAVPYFRNGQSIGMRLFAIRKDSMYEKLGLKNGDILLAVNEHNLSDPSEALKIFQQLRNERSIGVKLERNGQPKQMSYAIR